MALPDRHLDLGCGKCPRNPYGRDQLCGVDIRPLSTGDSFDYRVANLVLEPIPWADASFGSVSAYDFIEHMPRILLAPGGRDTMFPFIALMNEVWRVLGPGGRFYALTPAWPHADAFVDPTHVNIITEGTHRYFCGAQPLARMYGFNGRFEALRAEWVHIEDAYSTLPGSPENRPAPRRRPPFKRFARAVRALSRHLRGHPEPRPAPPIYFLWELEALKP